MASVMGEAGVFIRVPRGNKVEVEQPHLGSDGQVSWSPMATCLAKPRLTAESF